LFAAACTIWVSAIVLLVIRRNELIGLVRDLGRALIPQHTARAATPLRAAA
jgi:hypothetical protein